MNKLLNRSRTNYKFIEIVIDWKEKKYDSYLLNVNYIHLQGSLTSLQTQKEHAFLSDTLWQLRGVGIKILHKSLLLSSVEQLSNYCHGQISIINTYEFLTTNFIIMCELI